MYVGAFLQCIVHGVRMYRLYNEDQGSLDIHSKVKPEAVYIFDEPDQMTSSDSAHQMCGILVQILHPITPHSHCRLCTELAALL